MRKLFIPIVILLILFEIASVYFIMPMPGSQRWNVVGLSHFLYSWRWPIRCILYLFLVLSIVPAFRKRKFLVVFMVLIACAVTWAFNFPMTASHMFQPLNTKLLVPKEVNKINWQKLVIGVEINGDARAYPIEMIGYHHRVFDTVGGKSILVTYCTVCRTGRVYEPLVNGKQDEFRLVGMDHFNAMFEDRTTGTWWRQSTGEACAGKLKGEQLPVVSSVQMTLREWLKVHPDGKVLQWDTLFVEKYKRMKKFDVGNSGNKLTGSDTGSWKEKSWVLGIQGKSTAHVYDWNWVKKQDFVIDSLEGRMIIIWIDNDKMSYYAFYLPQNPQRDFADLSRWYRTRSIHDRDGAGIFIMGGKGKLLQDGSVNIDGQIPVKFNLEPAPVYQEFWHSWRTFHPGSIEYPARGKHL